MYISYDYSCKRVYEKAKKKKKVGKSVRVKSIFFVNAF